MEQLTANQMAVVERFAKSQGFTVYTSVALTNVNFVYDGGIAEIIVSYRVFRYNIPKIGVEWESSERVAVTPKTFKAFLDKMIAAKAIVSMIEAFGRSDKDGKGN